MEILSPEIRSREVLTPKNPREAGSGALARADFEDGGNGIFGDAQPPDWSSGNITSFRGLVRQHYEGNLQRERKFMLAGFPTRRDDYLRQLMVMGPHDQYHLVGALDVIGKGAWPAGRVLTHNIDAIDNECNYTNYI